MKASIFALVCLLPVILSAGEIIIVDDDGPANFNTIQAAMDYARDGDTVVVETGTYYENVHYNGKAVILTGTNPNDPNIISSTIISASSGYGVSFDSNEADDSVLTGFTITGRGVYCHNKSSPTISKNIIRDCATWGIYGYGQQNVAGQPKAAPVISENILSKNKGAIAYCNGPITNNIISENVFNVPQTPGSGGLSFCDGYIAGNVIAYNYSWYQGGGAFECDGDITNNTFMGNASVNAGGALYSCKGNIYNNIITGNKSDNSGGGLFGCKNIYNNTIVGNFAADSGGAISQCFGGIKNNIIAYNKAGSIGGISGPSNNTYNCVWVNQPGNFGSGSSISPTDIVINPQFAINGSWDTKGTENQNDDVWIDGDYHLKSEAGRWDPDAQSWVQDSVTSSCIDAGDPNTALIAEFWPHGNRVNMGAYGNTAQASWSLSNAGNVADLNYDGWIDYEDMAMLTGKWLHRQVLLVEDLDRDAKVDLADLSILLANWKLRPPVPKPPTPDPMTWQMEPSVVSSTAIVMVAATAVSTDGSGVEYYFKCDTPGGHDSGWQNTPGYTDAGLTPSTEYFYRVKARNQANLVETGFSPARSAKTASEDSTAPNPNPAQWKTQPYPVPPSSIRMVAATASDPSGVEYYFQCTSNPLYSSNWQASPEYVASSLPKGTYSFVVRVRDKSPKHNTTADSTAVGVDLQPPVPDPMQWAAGGEPKEVYRGGGALVGYWAVMTAAQATDANGAVEYYFLCTTESGFSSGWQSSPTYEVQIGRKDQYQKFRVKARDIYGNETAYSPELPAI